MTISIFGLFSIFITLLVIITMINHVYFKLPSTIAIMSGSLIIALLANLAHAFGIPSIAAFATNVMNQVDFYNLLINGMLSFLLFAGALTIDLSTLKAEAKLIGSITIIGVIISTVLLGLLIHLLSVAFGHPLELINCFIFGALISPTDPIAVLATFKKLGAPKRIRVIVAGESLFNDGVGIVMFMTLTHFVTHHEAVTLTSVSKLFCQQALGGTFFGMIIGYLAHLLMKLSKDTLINILITLAVTTAGYSLAQVLQVSGPLAMVAAGIFIGNRTLQQQSKQPAVTTLHLFWEIIDEVLNAVLFLLLGLELLTIKTTPLIVLAALGSIPLALITRYASVLPPLLLSKNRHSKDPSLIRILTWGGLKGGLAVALALSLPHQMPEFDRTLILCMTFAIVTFSIIVQGSTIKKCLPKE